MWQDGQTKKNPFSKNQTLPDDLKIGDIVESCPTAEATIATLGARLKTQGGCLLVIDYGYAEPAAGDSFQAIEARGKAKNSLARPGMADLTAHVNFACLAACGRTAGLTAHPLVSQGDFLAALGIELRTQYLAKKHPERASAIRAEQYRLTSPFLMGDLFKVLCLTAPDMPLPGGFAA